MLVKQFRLFSNYSFSLTSIKTASVIDILTQGIIDSFLDEFEQNTNACSYADFERRLSELRKGTNYQDAKGIISAAHKDGRYHRLKKFSTEYNNSNPY